MEMYILMNHLNDQLTGTATNFSFEALSIVELDTKKTYLSDAIFSKATNSVNVEENPIIVIRTTKTTR